MSLTGFSLLRIYSLCIILQHVERVIQTHRYACIYVGCWLTIGNKIFWVTLNIIVPVCWTGLQTKEPVFFRKCHSHLCRTSQQPFGLCISITVHTASPSTVPGMGELLGYCGRTITDGPVKYKDTCIATLLGICPACKVSHCNSALVSVWFWLWPSTQRPKISVLVSVQTYILL